MPGATVRLTALSTRAVRQVSSNEQGMFEVIGLLPGDYELKTEAPGFARLTQSLRLEIGQQMTLDVSLKLASLSESVEVAGEIEVLRTRRLASGA